MKRSGKRFAALFMALVMASQMTVLNVWADEEPAGEPATQEEGLSQDEKPSDEVPGPGAGEVPASDEVPAAPDDDPSVISDNRTVPVSEDAAGDDPIVSDDPQKVSLEIADSFGDKWQCDLLTKGAYLEIYLMGYEGSRKDLLFPASFAREAIIAAGYEGSIPTGPYSISVGLSSNFSFDEASKGRIETVSVDHVLTNGEPERIKVYSLEGLFSGMSRLRSADLSLMNCQPASSEDGFSCKDLFKGCRALTDLKLCKMSGDMVMKNAESMFEGCSALTELDLSDIQITNIEHAKRMFYGCSSLEVIYVDWRTGGFDHMIVSDPGEFKDIFAGCTSLEGGEGTKFDPNKSSDDSAIRH